MNYSKMVEIKRIKKVKKVKKRKRKKSTDIGLQVVIAVTGTDGIQGQDLEKETSAVEKSPKSTTRRGRIELKTRKTSVLALSVLTWLSIDRGCKRLKRLKNCASSNPKSKA